MKVEEGEPLSRISSGMLALLAARRGVLRLALGGMGRDYGSGNEDGHDGNDMTI